MSHHFAVQSLALESSVLIYHGHFKEGRGIFQRAKDLPTNHAYSGDFRLNQLNIALESAEVEDWADAQRLLTDPSPFDQMCIRDRVLEVIGGGGMGMVYKAEDLKLGRRVALKFLPEEMVSDPVSLKRFQREAQTASSLNHPNICTIFEIEEFEGQPILVMELLDGETLRDHLAASESKQMPLDQLLEIAVQTCSGLQAAHAKGIIHRDIKPANIFLTRHGPAKILDFGVAKLIEAEELLSLIHI